MYPTVIYSAIPVPRVLIQRLAIVCLLLAVAALAVPARATQHELVLEPKTTNITFLLEATGHDVEGRLFLQEGRLHFDTTAGTASGRIVLGAPRTETGNEKRDKTMHQKVLESTIYPEIVLVPQRIEGPIADTAAGKFQLEGVLTLHGKDHQVSMPTEVEVDDDGQLAVHATLDVPYVEWGLEDPSILFLRVAKVVKVDIRFTASLQASSKTESAEADHP